MRHDLDIEADIAARLENLLALILGFNLELSAGGFNHGGKTGILIRRRCCYGRVLQ